MVRSNGIGWLACAGFLGCLFAPGHALAQAPSYKIMLRSRSGDVVPERNKDGRTAGGYVDIVQPTPDTVLITMRGVVLAGSEQHRPGMASLQFILNQDFEIVSTRGGLRAPRLTLAGQLVGTLRSTGPLGGNAQQEPACALVNFGGQPILKMCIKPHEVTSGQNLFVNQREGDFEAVVEKGGYHLQQTLRISASAPPPTRHVFPRVAPAASVDFDPESKIDGPWIQGLQAFRGVPERDFGFSVRLHVEESPATESELPPPRVAPEKD